MRSLSRSQSPRYVNTLSRHSRLNSATPSASMCCLPLMPSCFSTSISTGRPCVSHPALRVHAIALHRAMAAEEILDRAREHVMDARLAVRRRRAFEEHERLGAPARAASVRAKRSSSSPAREQLVLDARPPAGPPAASVNRCVTSLTRHSRSSTPRTSAVRLRLGAIRDRDDRLERRRLQRVGQAHGR